MRKRSMWNLEKVKLLILLSTFYVTSSAKELNGTCPVATFHLPSYLCKYVFPSVFGLLVLSVVIIVMMSCKLIRQCRARKRRGNNNMVISDLLKYDNSPNIHSIVDGPSPSKCSTTIEIKPATSHQNIAEHKSPSSKSFLGEISSEEKKANKERYSFIDHKPSSSKSNPPKSIYMSLKWFIPSPRRSFKSLRCGPQKNIETIDECYDDTVEKVTQVEYVDMSSKLENKSQVVPGTESITDNKTGEINKQLMRDYVNVSPSNPNESAANCSYAFPHLRSGQTQRT